MPLDPQYQHLYLTDPQYLLLLQKIKEIVSDPQFKPTFYNSNTIGDKYTTSNCGMCNEEMTTLESAMFPDQFPKQKSRKYAQKHHKCPFDFRTRIGWNGCFYTCWLFKRGLRDVQKIQQLVEQQIQHGIANETINGNDPVEITQCPKYASHQAKAIEQDKGTWWESVDKKGCYLWMHDRCTATQCHWDGSQPPQMKE